MCEIKKPKKEKTQINISYETYSTQQDKFQIWTDVIFKKIGLPIPLSSIVIGLAVWLGGLIISVIIGFQNEYISSKILYVGVFGISYVIGIIRYSCLLIHPAIEKMRPCFFVDDSTYKEKITKWFSLMSDKKYHTITAIILMLIAWSVVYISFLHPNILQQLNIKSLRPTVIETYWYDQEFLVIKMFIFIYYSICIAFPFGSSLIILIFNYFFIRELREFAIVPLPNIVRFRLRKLTNLYVFVAMAWFIGVGLFGIVLFDTLDYFSTFFLLLISLVGTITFFTPQIVYRKFLMNSYDLSCKIALTSFYDLINIKLNERQNNKHEANCKIDAGANLADLVTSSEETKLWVYSFSDIAVWLIGQVFSLGSVFLVDFISSHL